jgi:hypothetical protein
MDPSAMMWAEAAAPARLLLSPPPCYTGHTPGTYTLNCKESRNDQPNMLSDRGAINGNLNNKLRSMSSVASVQPSNLESGQRVWIDLGATVYTPPQQVYIADNDPRASELWEQERERERQRREDQCVKTAGTRHRDLALRSSQMIVADDAEAVMGLTVAGKM